MFVLLGKCEDKRIRVLDTDDLVIEDVHPELVLVAKSNGYTTVFDDTFDIVSIAEDDGVSALLRGMGLPERGCISTDEFVYSGLVHKIFVSYGKNDNELDLIYCEWDAKARYGYFGYKRLNLFHEAVTVMSVSVFTSDYDITLSILVQECYGNNIRLNRVVNFKDLEHDSSKFRYKGNSLCRNQVSSMSI